MPTLLTKTYTDLLFKELEVIQDVIKNLDDIIYKSKNFAFLAWGGSLYIVMNHLKIENHTYKGYVMLLTAIIPLLFWAMDYKWRKHILQCSKRIRIISLFINSDEFRNMGEGNDFPKFPVYDPVGWIYTKRSLIEDADMPKDRFDPKYMIDENEFRGAKVIFYKDAYLFYATMLILSVILGIVILL